MTDEIDDSCFDTTEFVGTMSYDSHVAEVKFTAKAGQDCRLIIDPIGIEVGHYASLNKAMGRPGQIAKCVSLSGESIDGKLFSSENMDVSGIHSSSEGFFVSLTPIRASVTLVRKDDGDDPGSLIKFSLRGFTTFRPKPVKCKLGEVIVRGAYSVTSSDDVSGEIIVHSEQGGVDEAWYEQAENMAEFVWRGLAFGHGGHLQVPLEQVYRRESVTATFNYGVGQQRHLPSIHHLDQSAFIGALVARFESSDIFPPVVWQVVGWLNSDSTIEEVRFLTLMTAIEAIVENLVPDARTTLMPKKKYKQIREKLIETLSECELNEAERNVLSNKIAQLNMAPLSYKMKALIEKYDLSANVFKSDILKRLNDQRISIVHRGIALTNDDLWVCLIYAREIVARIVFAELQYTGRFESYTPDQD